MKRDLSIFIADNERWRSAKHRVPWKHRVELIKEEFPHVADRDWHGILKDEDVLGRILKDILKVDQMEPGRAGPRPNLDYERGLQTWKEMTGQDYSESPFCESFHWLIRGQSRTTVARKTNLSRTKVHRLLVGTEQPTIDELRVIAEAYGKKPAFFVEYRAEYIMAAVAMELHKRTEMAAHLYTKLVRSWAGMHTS